jgi:hypothetical protein
MMRMVVIMLVRMSRLFVCVLVRMRLARVARFLSGLVGMLVVWIFMGVRVGMDNLMCMGMGFFRHRRTFGHVWSLSKYFYDSGNVDRLVRELVRERAKPLP